MALEDIQSTELDLGSQLDAAEETITNRNTLDLSGIDNPFDSFNGLNLTYISDLDRGIKAESGENIALTTEQTTVPPTKQSSASLVAKLDAEAKKDKLRTQLYSRNQKSIYSQSVRPMQAFGEYEFDTYKSNIERFEAYGKETFREIGFNPLLDPKETEKHFNDNTGWWQDFGRMGGQFMSLSKVAFMSNYNSISNFFSGSSIIDPDEESDAAFSEANRIGMSTRGGFTGFATNLALNSAYSVGIAANIVAEEIAIWGAGLLLAPETGGGSLAAATAVQAAEGVSIASKISKLKNAMSLAFRADEVSKITRGGYGMLKSLSKVDDAKTFYQSFKTFGSGALGFVNPLRQTTSTLRGMYKGETAYRNMGNLAKMSRGFGSFYRDMRENWFTISEAQMEGGGVKKERLDENFTKYLEKSKGVLPTGKALDDIYTNAETAGRVDALGNIPLIFLTNRISFDGLFKFRGIGELVESFEKSATKGLGKKFMYNTASKTIEARIEEGLLKRARNLIKSPKNLIPSKKFLLGAGLSYTKANLSEGIQELGQEWLSGAVKNYYGKIYTDGQVTNARLLKTSIYDGLISATTSKESWQSVKDNIFSSQGLSTFASGFLMGGLIGGTKNSLTSVANSIWTMSAEAYMKYNDPNAFKAYQKNKLEIEQKHAAILNNMLSSPENFFNSKYETFHNQKTNSDNMDAANDANSAVDFHDAKDKLTYDHVMETLQSGTYDVVLDGFNELEKLSDSELADYFNIKDGSKAREKLSEYKDRAENIKKRYDFFKENTPNPFNPSKLKKGSEEQVDEFIAYKAFEDAKKDAIFSQYSFDRALERMVSIYDDILKDPPLKNISESELSVVVNPNTIAPEVKLLRQEAELLQQSDNKEDRKLGKNKLKRAAILEQYLEEYKKASEEKDYTKLFKIYKAYLKVLANEKKDYLFDSSIDDSFSKILDHYQLSDDSKTHMANVNYLTNPQNLVRHAQRIRATLRELYNNREKINKEGLDNFFKMVDINGLIDALGKINIIIDPDQLVEFYKTGKLPKTFIDIKSGKELSSDDPRMINIQGMLDILTKLTSLKSRVEAIPTEEKTPEATPKKEPVVTEEGEEEESKEETPIAKDVNDKLEEAYNKFIDETGSSMTFDDFVATHPAAARIKAEATPKAPEVQPVVTPAASTPTAAAPVVTATKVEPIEETPTAPVSDIEAKKADIERRRQKEIDSITPIKSEDVTIDGGDSFDFTLTFRVITFKDGSTIIRHIKSGDTVADGKSKKLNNYPTFNDFNNFFAEDLINSKGIIKTELIKDNYTDKQSQETKAAKEKTINAKYDAELAALKGTTTISNVEAKKANIERRKEIGYSISRPGDQSSFEKNKFVFTYVKPFDINELDKIPPSNHDSYVLNKYGEQKTFDNYDEGEKWLDSKYDAELDALEGKPSVTEPTTAREQIAQEKINQVMSGVKSLREAPSMNLNDGSKASKELLNLISTGEITSDQAEAAAKQKYEELLNNLKLSDFMKGDVVTFKDGRKGIVVDVLKDSLNMKMFDGPGIIEKMDASKVMNNIASIKNTKQAIEDSQKEPQVNVSKEDEDNMKKSQEGTDNLATDSKRASDAINNGIDNANKDQAPGFDDLFIGCDD